MRRRRRWRWVLHLPELLHRGDGRHGPLVGRPPALAVVLAVPEGPRLHTRSLMHRCKQLTLARGWRGLARLGGMSGSRAAGEAELRSPTPSSEVSEADLSEQNLLLMGEMSVANTTLFGGLLTRLVFSRAALVTRPAWVEAAGLVCTLERVVGRSGAILGIEERGCSSSRDAPKL